MPRVRINAGVVAGKKEPGRKKLLRAIRTEVDLEKLNIVEASPDESDESEDDAPAEEAGEHALEGDDDENAYDSLNEVSPLDLSKGDIDGVWGVYVARVVVSGDRLSVVFSKIPIFETVHPEEAQQLQRRYELVRRIAETAVERQRDYILGKVNRPANLHQQELVASLQEQGFRIEKEHIARLLEVLRFNVPGRGIVAAKSLMVRHGKKIALSNELKLSMAARFLVDCPPGISRLEQARGLHAFAERELGAAIPLSENQNPHDRYRHWKNIIAEAEKERDRESSESIPG